MMCIRTLEYTVVDSGIVLFALHSAWHLSSDLGHRRSRLGLEPANYIV